MVADERRDNRTEKVTFPTTTTRGKDQVQDHIRRLTDWNQCTTITSTFPPTPSLLTGITKGCYQYCFMGFDPTNLVIFT